MAGRVRFRPGAVPATSGAIQDTPMSTLERRETGLELDRRREFRHEDYPRQPPEYHMTDHFRQRFKNDDRFLTGSVIRQVITEGRLSDNNDGCAAFCTDVHGVEYWFLAGYHVDGYRVAVTAWPYLREYDRAANSGYWREEELDTIISFNRKTSNYTPLKESYPEYVEWSMNHPDGGDPIL